MAREGAGPAMIPYVFQELHSEHVEVWKRACGLVEKIPDEGFENVRCHELARAVFRVLCTGGTPAWRGGQELMDGRVGAVEHSWIKLGGAILDPYFPGVLPQCVLIDGWDLVPMTTLYKRGPDRTDIDEAMVERLVGVFQGP